MNIKLKIFMNIAIPLLTPISGNAENLNINNIEYKNDNDLYAEGKQRKGVSENAISISNNSIAEFNGKVDATSKSNKSVAISLAKNSDARFNDDVKLTTSGAKTSHGLQVTNSSSSFSGNLKIKTDGLSSYGISSSLGNVKVNKGLEVSTIGSSSIAIYAINNSNVELNGSSRLNTEGDASYGVYVDGSKGDSSLKSTNTIVNTKGNSAHGIYAANGHSKIELYGNNSIETKGILSYGMISSKDNSSIDVIGSVSIITYGDKSSGALSSASNINLGSNAVITTNGTSSHGVSSKKETLTSNNLVITTKGNSSYGANSTDNSVINLNGSGYINTSGNESHGIYSTENSTINIDNADIHTSGNNSHSLYSSNGSLININKKNGFIISDDGVSLYLKGGEINANLSSVFIKNNGILALSKSSEDGNVSNLNLKIHDAPNIIGDIYAEKNSINNLYMSESTWTGKSKNANEIILDNSSKWILNGESDVKNLSNSGSIFLNEDNKSGNTLTVNGSYSSDNGNIFFNGELSNDNSKIDKLIINGDSYGMSNVIVRNLGGVGANTNEGIEIIEVKGQSLGSFVQKERIIAGSYDYRLQKGNNSQSNDSLNNWYLTSTTPEAVPTKPEPEAVPTKPVHTWRPEAASYTANLEAANTLFATRLHDRLGEAQYTDALTGEKKVTSMWIRNEGGRNQYTMSDGQNKTTSNRYVLQLGGDIAQWSNDGLDRFHLGVMGGYANQHSNTTNNLTGYHSKGSIDGYSAGLYGTWYQNDASKAGLYFDTWALYNWFNNHVNGEGLASEKYHTKGITASVESGYTFLVGSQTTSQGMTNDFYIQPQVQLTWFGIKAKDHTEDNGTYVQGIGNNNLQARIGTRFYLKGKSTLDKNNGRQFEPFVETNWIYNSKQYGTKMDGISDSSQGSRNVGEVKVGIEGQLTNNLNVWSAVGQQMGKDNYRDTQGQLGVKYMF